MYKKIFLLSAIFLLSLTVGKAQTNAASADKNSIVTTPTSQTTVNTVIITHYSDQKENITPTISVEKEDATEKRPEEIQHLDIKKEEELNPRPKN